MLLNVNEWRQNTKFRITREINEISVFTILLSSLIAVHTVNTTKRRGPNSVKFFSKMFTKCVCIIYTRKHNETSIMVIILYFVPTYYLGRINILNKLFKKNNVNIIVNLQMYNKKKKKVNNV